MNPEIIIHRPDGDQTMVAHVGKGSKRVFMLMEKDYITLKFSTATPRLLRVGDYVDIEGGDRYEITKPTSADKNKTTGGYDYDIQLDAQYWKFKNKLMKFLPFIGTGETSWSYTDTLRNHAQQVLMNIRALAYRKSDGDTEQFIPGREGFLYNGVTDWAIDCDTYCDDSIDIDKATTISYDSTNIIGAISAIAEAYECEWWFEQNVLYFGKCEYGTTPIDLMLGREVVNMSRKDSKEDYATRIYAYGSDRNMPSNYRKDLLFTAGYVNGSVVKDEARPLDANWFPASMRVTSPADRQTFSISGGWGEQVSTGGNSDTILVKETSATVSNINGGAWMMELSKYRPRMSRSIQKGSMTTARIEVLTTVRFADGTIENDRQENSLYFPYSGYEAVGTFSDKRFDFFKAVTNITVTVKFYADLGRDTSAVVSITAYGTIPLTNRHPNQGVAGIRLQVIDGTSGEVEQTIEGVVFNPNFEETSSALQLPPGSSVAFNKKFVLPQINKAIVPASYFTSKYTAFEKYTDIIANGIVNNRLLLPEKDENDAPLNGYIDVVELEHEDEAVEDVVVFEDIYPSRISTVREVTPITGTYSDEQKEQDGSTTYIPWTAYKIKDDLFNEANPFDIGTYKIDGKDLQITFQSGVLNGMTFDVLYTDDDRLEIQRDKTTLLPNEMLHPKVGDTYILSGFNIAMLNDEHTDYISSAENALLQKAREYAQRLNTDASTYDCTIGCDYAKNAEPGAADGLYLGIGRRVNLINPAYFENGRISRVIGYEIPLDIPYDNPIYTIGEKASYTRIGAIEDKIDGLKTNPGTLGGIFGGTSGAGTTGSGSGVYVIGQVDTTPPTDKNVYSALRSRLEFAMKKMAEKISVVWTFLQGIRIGEYVQGSSGAVIDAAGNAEVESLTSRSFLKVFELIYNRLNALEGNTSFSDSGTIESVSVNPNSSLTLSMRKRWDGDFTAFQIGDIIYGYVNDLSTSGTHYKSWMRITAADRANNTLTAVLYPDSEVPSGHNYPPTAGMVVSRWGNAVEPNATSYANPDYASFIRAVDKNGTMQYANVRQSSFFISCDNGNIVELMGVNKPILERWNYGAVLGQLPKGLLPPEKEGLINDGQPYLYARGAVIQDLIRIDYQGRPIREQHYRGEWSLQIAQSETDYYRNTDKDYDTVTHNGEMWQCLANGTTDEPSYSNGSWLAMTSNNKSLQTWQILPDATTITIRQTQTGVESIPPTLSCKVLLLSTEGNSLFSDTFSLAQRGVKLWYSLDGSLWREYVMGGQDLLELEDGGYVEAENSSEDTPLYITVGGDDISAIDITDRVAFELRSIDTDEMLTQCVVPVVKDGVSYLGTQEFYAWGDSGENPPFEVGDPRWQTTPTKSDSLKYLWNYEVIRYSNGDVETTEPHCVSADGRGILRFEEHYMATSSPVAPDAADERWAESAMPSNAEPYLWNRETPKFDDNTSGTPIVRLIAQKGGDGKGYEYIYITTTAFEAPEVPSESADVDDFVPDGWSDDPPQIDSTNRYCWMASRRKSNGTWSEWTGSNDDPTHATLWNIYSTSVRIKGTLDSEAELPTPPSDPSDCYIIGQDLYVWDGSQWNNVGKFTGDEGPQGPQGPQGETGPSGQDAFSVSLSRESVIFKSDTEEESVVQIVVLASKGAEPIPYTGGNVSAEGYGYGCTRLSANSSLSPGLIWSFGTKTEQGRTVMYYELKSRGCDTDHIDVPFDVTIYKDGEPVCSISKTISIITVKDGETVNGRDGLMAYPAGVFDFLTVYSSTTDTTPVVLCNGSYYILLFGKVYSGFSAPPERDTPEKDAALGGEEACWRLVDRFNSIFADIVMAEFAKLASAVFYRDWMISRQGTVNGVPSTEFKRFKTGEFDPNLLIDYNQGEIEAKRAKIKGSVIADSMALGFNRLDFNPDSSDVPILTESFYVTEGHDSMLYFLPDLPDGTSRTIELMVTNGNSSPSPSDAAYIEFAGLTSEVKIAKKGNVKDAGETLAIAYAEGLYRLTGWHDPAVYETYWNVTYPEVEVVSHVTQPPVIRPPHNPNEPYTDIWGTSTTRP